MPDDTTPRVLAEPQRRDRRESGKRVRRDTSAHATGTPENAPHRPVRATPIPKIAGSTPPRPEDVLVQRFMAQSALLVRDLLREHREALMRAAPPPRDARHVAIREDLEAAEHVDELTRARARQLLTRVANRKGVRR
jgi:hypothetical protein